MRAAIPSLELHCWRALRPTGTRCSSVTSAFANNPFLYANLPYKTPEAFTPVSILTAYPFVLAVHSGLQFKSIKELIEYAKANPGKLTAATSGRGAAAQLALGLLNKNAGIQIREIPFKGIGEGLNNVAGGFVDMIFAGYESALPVVDSRRIRFLAHTGMEPLGKERIPPIANDLPGFEYQNWQALIAPAGTPEAVTDKLNGALKEIFAEQGVKERLAGQNISAIASTSAEAKDYILKDIAANKAIIEGIGLKPE